MLSIVMRSRNGVLEAQTAAVAPAEVATSGEDSDERNATAAQPRKKLKSTYYSRKEEIESLRVEEGELEKQLARLESPSEASKLAAAVEKHAELQLAAQRTSLVTAGAQSLLNSSMEHNPLSTYIHLTADPLQRERALQAARELHIHKAIPYLLERARFQNLRRSTRQSDAMEAANGDVFFRSFDVTSFADTQCSLAQLYDELVWLTRHQEFIMFDSFGVSSYLEVDTYDENISSASQVRILSSIVDDVELEKNIAVLRCFHPHGSQLLPAPHAVVALESVDHDELYPYRCDSRVRLDMSCVLLLLEVPPASAGGNSSVSVLRGGFKRLHKPQFPLTTAQEDRVHEVVNKWGEILFKTLRTNLLAKGPR